jgi:hypothetical protein
MCAVEGYVVLLDIERDKYLAVDGRHSRGLSELIDGWPSGADDQPIRQDAAILHRSASAESIVGRLLQRGLVTEDFCIGKSAAPVATTAATETFPIFALELSLRPYIRYLPSFLIACARAHRLRRKKPLARVVERIQQRRRRWTVRQLDEGRLRILVRAHHHLRPLIYTTRDGCLYDSLVLLEFLARYQIDATWVFGCHTSPWIPHCWVRAGSYLLNDTPGNIACCSVLAEF